MLFLSWFELGSVVGWRCLQCGRRGTLVLSFGTISLLEIWFGLSFVVTGWVDDMIGF
jgi:hypothetical protein